MKTCIFSGSTESLNTSMTVQLDNGSTVQVWISDEYADDATPRKVREAYLAKANRISELISEAKALGMDLTSLNDSGDVPVRPEADQNIAARQSNVQQETNHQNDEMTNTHEQLNKSSSGSERMISGRDADKALELRNVQSGSTGVSVGHEYSISSADDPDGDLKEGEQAEVDIIEGRGGISVAIPVRRQGKMGETNIKIVKGYNNNRLQQDFKKMANPEDNPTSFKDGYVVRFVECGLCKGVGQIRGDKQCPKCSGSGEIQV